jgi:hypothetical protein
VAPSDVAGLVCVGVVVVSLAVLIAHDFRSVRAFLVGMGILAVVLLLGLYAPPSADATRVVQLLVLILFWWFKPRRSDPVRPADPPPTAPPGVILPDAGLRWADRQQGASGAAVPPPTGNVTHSDGKPTGG